jgi:hypothetical protein
MTRDRMRKLAGVAVVTVIAILAGVAPLATPKASAFYEGDCYDREPVDVDYLQVDTGYGNNVDLGDDHVYGAPRGPAIVCWEDVAEPVQVQFKGEFYWDTECCGAPGRPNQVDGNTGCGTLKVSFSPTTSGGWGSKTTVATACRSSGWGIYTAYFDRTFTKSYASYAIRVQLYKGSRLVHTIVKKLGD